MDYPHGINVIENVVERRRDIPQGM